jgi:hypothetical protein
VDPDQHYPLIPGIAEKQAPEAPKASQPEAESFALHFGWQPRNRAKEHLTGLVVAHERLDKVLCSKENSSATRMLCTRFG